MGKMAFAGLHTDWWDQDESRPSQTSVRQTDSQRQSERDKHPPITHRAWRVESGGTQPGCFGSEFNMSKSVCLKSNEAAGSLSMLAQGSLGSKERPSGGSLNSLEWNRVLLCSIRYPDDTLINAPTPTCSVPLCCSNRDDPLLCRCQTRPLFTQCPSAGPRTKIFDYHHIIWPHLRCSLPGVRDDGS